MNTLRPFRKLLHTSPALLLVLAGCATAPLLTENRTQGRLGPQQKKAAVEEVLRAFSIGDGTAADARLKVIEPLPADWRAAYERGRTAREKGQKVAALEGFAEAHRAAPDEPSPLLPLAQVLRRVHRPDFAEATLRRLLDLEPRHVAAKRELAALLASLGRRQEAADAYDDLLAQAPGDAAAHARLAVQRYYLGETESARASLVEARRLGAEGPDILPALLDGAPPRAAVRDLEQIDAGPAVRIDAGGTSQAAETSIAGRHPHLVAAWNDQRDGTANGVWRLGAAISADGGATWSEELIRPPGAAAGDFEGDPISAYDPRTGDLWIGAVSFYTGGSLYLARKRAGNGFFDAPVVTSDEESLFYDKPLLAAGPAPGAPQQTRLYIVFSEGLQSSGDLGATWSSVLQLGTPFEEVIYQPRVDDAGVLSIVSWDSAESIWLRRSTNGGASVGTRQLVATRMDVWNLQASSHVPGQFRAPPLPTLAVAADGTLYVLYCDTSSVAANGPNLDLYLTVSSDGGASWSTPRVIHGDADPPGDQFAPWLEIDETGRLHAVYFDSRYQAQDDTAVNGLIDVTYAFSDDGGASWNETRLTASSFSSADAFWKGAENVPDYQFLGDYLGLTPTGDGGAVAVYPAAVGGDLDVFSRRLTPPLFVDGFESGSLTAWSVSVGD